MTHHLKFALLAAVAGLFLLGSPAKAEVLEPGEAIKEDSVFSDFMGSENYMAEVFEIAREVDDLRGFECEESYEITNIRVQVHEKISINRGDVEPSEGEWVMPISMSRCGGEMTMTIHSFVTSNGDVDTTLLVPGDTNFYPNEVSNLQAVLPQVIGAAGGDAQCNDISVLTATASAPESHEVSNPDMKYETWLISGCGTDVEVIWRMEPVDDQMQIKVEGISVPQS